MEEKEAEKDGRGGQRLIRLVFLGVGIFLVLMLVKNFAGQPGKERAIKLPELSVGEIQPQNILGIAESLIKREGESQEGEPIAEPAENIQNQTQLLIEAIKKLPEDQLEAVRKQIYKEFCQDYCQESSPLEEGKDE